MVVEEFYFTLLDISTAARCDRIPGPLARTMLDVAHKTLDLWRKDE